MPGSGIGKRAAGKSSSPPVSCSGRRIGSQADRRPSTFNRRGEWHPPRLSSSRMVPWANFRIGFSSVSTAERTLSLPRESSSFITKKSSGTNRSAAGRAKRNGKAADRPSAEVDLRDGWKPRRCVHSVAVKPPCRFVLRRDGRSFAVSASRAVRQRGLRPAETRSTPQARYI